jgi:hypothetical protein
MGDSEIGLLLLKLGKVSFATEKVRIKDTPKLE